MCYGVDESGGWHCGGGVELNTVMLTLMQRYELFTDEGSLCEFRSYLFPNHWYDRQKILTSLSDRHCSCVLCGEAN